MSTTTQWHGKMKNFHTQFISPGPTHHYSQERDEGGVVQKNAYEIIVCHASATAYSI